MCCVTNGGLILVAASGLALETAEAARAAGMAVAGCVDDDDTRWGTSAGGWLTVLGGMDVVAAQPDSPVAVCAGKGTTRVAIVDRLRRLGVSDGRFATVVHPSVVVPPSCSVGPGSIVLAGCVLTASATLGSHVVLMPNVVVTHDDVVEDFATLCAGVVLGGYVRVGRAAYLGMNSSVRERVAVGAEVTLGMGAVLVGDLPAGQTWVGVPARPVDGGAAVGD